MSGSRLEASEGGSEHDQAGDVESMLGGEGGGDEAAHAVADDEERDLGRPVGEPIGGVVEEVLGVIALEGDATDTFGAAVGSLVEGVDSEACGGQPFGDVA